MITLIIIETHVVLFQSYIYLIWYNTEHSIQCKPMRKEKEENTVICASAQTGL